MERNTMELERVRDFLSDYHRAKKGLQYAEECIEELQGAGANPGDDLKQMKKGCEDRMHRVASAVSMIHDDDARMVVFCRFIKLMNVDETAEHTCFSSRHTQRIVNRGLAELSRITS